MYNFILKVRYFILSVLGLIKECGSLCYNGEKTVLINEGKVNWDVFDSWYSKNTETPPDGMIIYYNNENNITSNFDEVLMYCGYDDSADRPLTASKLYTGTKRFGYGYYELVAKVPPKGKKWWFAFWLWGNELDEWPPEIDIFEFMGKSSKVITFTNHFKKRGKHAQKGNRIIGSDLSNGYYSYGLEWAPKKITWYIGGIKVYQLKTNVPQYPMGITLTLNGDPEKLYKRGEFAVAHIKSLKYYRNDFL